MRSSTHAWCGVVGPGIVVRYVAAVATLLAAGCGGGGGVDPVPVEGVVTLDGSPLEGATVLFRPADGRPSIGTTDAEGRYRLRYTSERTGAVPGRHTVSITMLDEDSAAAAIGTKKKPQEPIPSRYNSQTELTAEVVGSKTTLDFALLSR
jgi:hypothetical protein